MNGVGPAVRAVSDARFVGFAAALRLQIRVISALMVRDALARFGHENLGFFWLFGEPLLLTVGVMGMWSLGGHGGGQQIAVVPFALSAYMMLTLWRHIVGKSVHVLRRNVGLLFHRDIKYTDVLIALAALECLGGLSAFFVAYLPLWLFDAIDVIHDPLLLIGAWMFMTWFSFAVGLVLAGLTEIYEAVERFVAPILYITLPVTGAFYMVHWLPAKLQKIVLWSPLVHIFEMFRAGMFGPDYPTEWNAGFVVLCCLVTTAAGLPLVQVAQKHVRME